MKNPSQVLLGLKTKKNKFKKNVPIPCPFIIPFCIKFDISYAVLSLFSLKMRVISLLRIFYS